MTMKYGRAGHFHKNNEFSLLYVPNESEEALKDMGDGVADKDLEAMNKLLSSWHVGILYELFKEEDITINELKMMQCSHINTLLKDYKMGVRIRFEYHFKSWRNKIGIPLKTVEMCHSMCCCTSKANIGNSCIENHHIQNTPTNTNATTSNINGAKRKRLKHNLQATDQTQLDENQAPLSPQSVNSNSSSVNMLTSNETLNLIPVPILDTANEKTHKTDEEAELEVENMPLNTLSELLSSPYETPPKFPSKGTPDRCPLNLKQILQLSGARGLLITKFFKEKNRLTNVHRSLLIQTIVDYFVENDHHLSLNMSHHLEWEILRMFPTEELEYYRTEKRGKIYVKFSNMKRYKRERINKMNAEMESLNTRSSYSQRMIENKEMYNLSQEENEKMNVENYEPEVMVKEENISDDGNNSE